jgi:hypothetical protein
MPSIPDTTDFRRILESLALANEQPGIEISDEQHGRLANGDMVVFPRIYLNYDQEGKIKVDALIRKLSDSWQGKEHPSTDRIAELVLAVFAVLKSGYPDCHELFNKLLESTVPVDVSHFAVFLGHGEDGKPADFEGFRFGAVKNLSLQHRSTRAHSNYFDLHGARILDRWCIESPIYRRSVICFLDFYREAPLRQNIAEEFFFRVLLNYYEEITSIYIEKMWQDLEDRQIVASAAGIEVFNVPKLKHAIGLSMIAVYLNQTSKRWDGYVVPTEHGLRMNTWVGNPPILQELKAFQAALSPSRSATLAQVARYGTKARRAAKDRDWSEALLNFTIAVELLFSEKSQTSQSVSRRLAAATSEATPESYSTRRKEIISLYDARSKYVHAGVAPTRAEVESMTELFERVLAVLIRQEKKQVLHDKEPFAAWIKTLDWIAAGYEAGQVPTTAVLEDAGLSASDKNLRPHSP